MSCTVSIIIATFQRPHLLKWGLFSLAGHDIHYPFETIVINDGIIDETEEICNQYKDKLNIKYIFSGNRNLGGDIKWRGPAFPINIGVKQSSGMILILSCAEMYHMNDTVNKLSFPLLANSKLMTIPLGWDDQDGSILNQVNNTGGNINNKSLNLCRQLNVHLPFLMGVSREDFYFIRGYDEDFTGIAYEDNDFVERLQANGCIYQQTEAKTVHLFHPRFVYGKAKHPAFLYNKGLYESHKGQIIRNMDREWGVL